MNYIKRSGKSLHHDYSPGSWCAPLTGGPNPPHGPAADRAGPSRPAEKQLETACIRLEFGIPRRSLTRSVDTFDTLPGNISNRPDEA